MAVTAHPRPQHTSSRLSEAKRCAADCEVFARLPNRPARQQILQFAQYWHKLCGNQVALLLPGMRLVHAQQEMVSCLLSDYPPPEGGGQRPARPLSGTRRLEDEAIHPPSPQLNPLFIPASAYVTRHWPVPVFGRIR